MTVEEFSNQLDVLLDSHKFKDEFGDVSNMFTVKLDEYEKSMLLTEAQEMILKEMFIGAFDKSEQVQMYYMPLIATAEITVSEVGIDTYSENGIIYKLPADNFWVLNERLVDATGAGFTVVPLHYKEYDRLASKPYFKPLKRQAWRLYKGTAPGQLNEYSEIIKRNSATITKYVVRYIRNPRPIILEDLGNLQIRGISTVSECELNVIAHPDILNRAVEIALSRYTTGYSSPNRRRRDDKEDRGE